MSDHNLPLVTIITSTYNADRFLEGSIASVASQTYSSIEYIIIDGGSSDGTLDILKKYDSKINYWMSEPDTGIYDAWNKALRVAKGEWLCFIGADDFFADPFVIEKMIPHLTELKKKEKKYVYGKSIQISEDKSRVIEIIGMDWRLCKRRFRNEMTLAHCGAMHHRSLFVENGNFDVSFKIAGDYEFLLREYRKDSEFASFLDIPIVKMRTGGISGDLKTRLLMANESIRARKLNGQNNISIPILLWIMRIRVYLFAKAIVGDGFSKTLADAYRSIRGKKRKWTVQ